MKWHEEMYPQMNGARHNVLACTSVKTRNEMECDGTECNEK